MRSRKSITLGLALFGALALAACTEENIVELPQDEKQIEVTASPQTAPLEIGQTVQIVASVKNTSNQQVTYTSNNNSIATVSASGLVTAVGAGTTTITVASVEDPNAKTGVTIVVSAPPPPPEVNITLQPEQLELEVGDVVQLVATVTGSENPNATCISSDTNVATIAQDCTTLEAKGAGTAVITATAAADNTKKATATIKVTLPPPPPEPSIAIESIVYPITLVAVNPNNVSGNIIVNLELDIPQGSGVERVELLLGDRVVASQSFSSAAQVDGALEEGAAHWSPHVATHAFCTVANGTGDAAFCSYVGEPRNPNGEVILSARAIKTGGEVAAQVDQVLTLNNTDIFYAVADVIPFYSESVGGWAINSNNGRRYHEGSVGVDLFFVNFSGNDLNENSVQVTLNVPGNPTRTGALSQTFPRTTAVGSGGVSDVTSGSPLAISIAGAYVGGNPLPGAANQPIFTQWNGQPAVPQLFSPGLGLTQETIYLDNQGPTPNNYQFSTQALGSANPIRCCLNNWVGREITFASFYAGGAEADAGVGVPSGTAHRTFYVGLADENNAAILAREPVTSGQDLVDILGFTPTASNNVYASVVKVVDKLNNPSNARLQTNAQNPTASGGGAVFGLDLVDPEIKHMEGASTRHLYVELDPTADIDFAFAYQDATLESSGFGATPVRVIRRTNFAGAMYSAVGGTYTIPSASGENYFGVEAEVYDRAGNKSPLLPQRLVLRDGTDPVWPGGSPLVLPASTSGNQVTYSVEVEDNRDLLWAEGVTYYEAPPLGAGVGLVFPTAFPVPLGTPWDAPNVTSATATATVPFLRGIELVGNGGGGAGNGGVGGVDANEPSGTLLTALGGGLRIRDAARRELYIVDAFTSPTPAPTPVPTAPGVGGVVDFAVTNVTPTTICNNEALVGCGNIPTQAQVTVQLRQHVAPGFEQSRLGKVYLYLAEDELAPYGGNVNHQDGVGDPPGDPIRFLRELDASAASVTTDLNYRTFTWTFTIDASSLYWGDGTLPTTFFNGGAATSIFAIGVRTDEPTGLRTLNNTSLTIVGDNNDPFNPNLP